MATSSVRRLVFVASLAVVAVAVSACVPGPTPPPPTGPGPGLLSAGSTGQVGNGAVTGASISSDGRFVTFSSAADDLVADDGDDVVDTFLRDRVTGRVERIVVATTGEPRISGNGRYVAVTLLDGDRAVYDRIDDTTVTWTTAVAQNTPVVADDGSVAIFGRTGSFGAFSTACRVRQLSTGVETDCPRGGPGNGTVALDAVSRTGRFVLYSWLDQDGGGTSGRRLWDRLTGAITTAPAGLLVFGNSVVVAEDGGRIAATDFVPGVPPAPRVFDLDSNTTIGLPGPAPDGATVPVDISADGTIVALYSEASNLDPADTNSGPDIYLWDTAAGTVELASTRIDDGTALPTGAVACGHGPGNMLASGDGVCVRTSDQLLDVDTNGVADAWLVPGPA